jgi:hypothetical protein
MAAAGAGTGAKVGEGMSYPIQVAMREGSVEWMYPEIYGKDIDGTPLPRSVLKIGLMHTRAANDIEIEYDSDRDGYVIYQMVTVGWKEVEGLEGRNCYEPIEKRKEKAFIPAWDEEEVSEPA